MDGIYEFTNRYGTTYKVAFDKGFYTYGQGLAIDVRCLDEQDGYWEPYCSLTVNIGETPMNEKAAFIDTNNVPDICDFVLGKGWANRIGEGASGFCTYPLVEFSDEFLNEVCTRL